MLSGNFCTVAGQFLMQQERYGEASVFLESVVNATSAQQGRAQYHDLINLATALRLTGRLQQAEHLYYTATALEPHVSLFFIHQHAHSLEMQRAGCLSKHFYTRPDKKKVPSSWNMGDYFKCFLPRSHAFIVDFTKCHHVAFQ
jgi:Tfp pilus assembly protein PilF